MRIPLKLHVISFFYSLGTFVLGKRNGSVRRRGWIPRLLSNPVPPSKLFENGVASEDITICNETRVSVRLYFPKKALEDSNSNLEGGKEWEVQPIKRNKVPVIIFFHGGGFVLMSKQEFMYDSFCKSLARETCSVIVSVDYRLSPENRYPAAVEDGLLVLTWLVNGGNDCNWIKTYADLEHVILSGDSAGANLVHQISIQISNSDFSRSRLKIVGQVLMWPFFGGSQKLPSEKLFKNGYIVTEKDCEWMWSKYLPGGVLNMDHEAVNPLFPGNNGFTRLKDLPRTLIFVAGLDYLHDRGVLYANALAEAGVEVELKDYKEMVHGFALLGYCQDSVLETIRLFIQK